MYHVLSVQHTGRNSIFDGHIEMNELSESSTLNLLCATSRELTFLKSDGKAMVVLTPSGSTLMVYRVYRVYRFSALFTA